MATLIYWLRTVRITKDEVLHLVVVVVEPSYRAHPHRRTVAIRGLGQMVGALQPLQEPPSIASHGVGVAAAPVYQCVLVLPSFGPTWHTLNDNMEHISRNTLKAVGQTMIQVIYTEE